MTNFDHFLDTLRYANRVKRNLERSEFATSVVENNPRENEITGNIQGHLVSITSRRNNLVHVDSGLSLESNRFTR